MIRSKVLRNSTERAAIKGIDRFRVFSAVVVGKQDVVFELELPIVEIGRKKKRRSFKSCNGLIKIELMGKAESNPIFASPIGSSFLLSQRRKSRR